MKIKEKEYDNDYELLYMIGENDEDASNLIYEKYKPVIDFYVKKYINLVSGKGIDYNDLYQEGLLGLDSAIKSYDNNIENKFSSFAFTCIERKIITEVKKVNRQKHKILNESFSIDLAKDDGTSLIDVITSDDKEILDLIVDKENEEIFNDKLKKELTSAEYEVYALRIKGYNYEEIAKELNKTIKSVGSSISRIKNKIRKILEEIN